MATMTTTVKSVTKVIRRLVLEYVNITDQEDCQILLRRMQVLNATISKCIKLLISWISNVSLQDDSSSDKCQSL